MTLLEEATDLAKGGVVLPLTAAQFEIWLAQQLDPNSPAYNIGEYIEIHGSIDVVLFERALRRVVSEAEALQVKIVADGSGQILGAPPSWSLPVFDLSFEPDARGIAEAWMRADLARPVDLTRGPLFGFALFKASERQFFWYARYHHILMDGYSMWLIASRLADVYTALCAGLRVHESPFGRLHHLVDEDACYRSTEVWADDRRFWLDYLSGQQGLARLKEPASGIGRGFVRQSTVLQKSTTERMSALARRMDARVPEIVSAIAAMLIHRVTAFEEPIFGLAVANRTGSLRTIPGMTSNVIPVRLSFHSRTTVSELVGQAVQRIRAGLEHQRYRFGELRRDLGISGRTFYGLGVNFMRFNYEFNFAGSEITAHNLSLGPIEELSVVVCERAVGGPLRIDFDGNPAVFNADELVDYQGRFVRLLEAAVAEPDRAIGRLDILSASERQTIVRIGTRRRVRSRLPACLSCLRRKRRGRRMRRRLCLPSSS